MRYSTPPPESLAVPTRPESLSYNAVAGEDDPSRSQSTCPSFDEGSFSSWDFSSPPLMPQYATRNSTVAFSPTSSTTNNMERDSWTSTTAHEYFVPEAAPATAEFVQQISPFWPPLIGFVSGWNAVSYCNWEDPNCWVEPDTETWTGCLE